MAEKQKPASDLADKFVVRMPEGLRERISIAAEQSGQSMNAEIVQALESSFVDTAELQDFLADIDFIVRAYRKPRSSDDRLIIRQVTSDLTHRIVEIWHDEVKREMKLTREGE